MTPRQQIKAYRTRIQERVQLWDVDTPALSVGPHWEQFDRGPAEVRILPSLCTQHQSVILVRAPAGTEITIQKQAEAEGLIVLASSDDPDPRCVLCYEEEQVVLRPGDAWSINPRIPHQVFIESGRCTLLLVWRPGLTPDPRDRERLLWHTPPRSGRR
jgi:quercetin dioxygenase-like cupin family protein